MTILLLGLTFISAALAESAVYTKVMEDAGYEETLASVKDIIIGKGINIAHTLPASDMLGRTGPDFGINEQVLKHGEIIEFCSASISHKLIKANPENITICPFSIAVYVLNSDPDNVRLTSRLPYVLDDQSKAATDEVQAFVKGIIDEAADW
jgi:uncharacterized protein (DUF302 family)